MAARRAAIAELRIHERPQIAEHSIVTGEQLVKLAAGADVLVVENDRRARVAQPVKLVPELFFELRDQRFAFWKKTRERREAVLEISRARRLDAQRRARKIKHVH